MQANQIVRSSLAVIVTVASLSAQAQQKASADGNSNARTTQATGTSSGSAIPTGVVRGQPFQALEVCYDESRLIFKSAPKMQTANLAGAIPITHGDAFIGIALNFPTGQSFDGEYFVSAKTNILTVNKHPQPRPELMRYSMEGMAESAWHSNAPYSMSLKFFKKVNGMLPGYIDLSVTDGKEQTQIKGFFYAVKKPLAL